MRLLLPPSLLFLLPSSRSALVQKDKEEAILRHLLKTSNRKDSNRIKNDVVAEPESDTGVDLKECYYNLLSASNYDYILSQSDFLTFVNLQSNGVGVTTPWGTSITSFNQLSAKFVGVYNEYACGDALVGCPTIEGIEVENVYDLEGGFLGRLCGSMAEAVEEYSLEIGSVSVESGEELEKEEEEESELPISFTFQIGNTANLSAYSILSGSYPSNTMKDSLVAGMAAVVKDVVQEVFYEEDAVYVDGSIRIDNIQDVECANLSSDLVCQNVVTTIDVIVGNQTKEDIKLTFLQGITEALNAGEFAFPTESGVILVDEAGVASSGSVNDVPTVGYKPSEGGFGGFPGLGLQEEKESTEANWKVPMLACASVVVFVASLVFAVVRKSHREDQNKLINNGNNDDMFIGELMENDTGAFKRGGDGAPNAGNPAGDIERGSASTCSSSDPSNPFSDVISKHSSNSSTPSSPEESPGNTTSEDAGEFSSMVNGANTNPFSLQSVASSSMEGTMSPNPTITPGESPNVMVYEQSGGSSYDSLDNYVKTRLSLDNYDDWLSTVAESDDEFSKSDVSSLSEVVHDATAPIVSPEKNENNPEESLTPIVSNSCRKLIPPESDCSPIDEGNHSDDDTQNVVPPNDNIAAPLAATIAMDHSIDDSSAATSRMTDVDGASSIEASTITSDITFMEAPRMLLTHIGTAFNNMKMARKTRPIFEFATSPQIDEEGSGHLDSDSLDEIKTDLASAIRAGDWTAVSATALLLAKADPSAADFDDMQFSVMSKEQSILTSKTQQERASELDSLVTLGDWKGVLMAVSQFEGASDTESFAVSVLDEQQISAALLLPPTEYVEELHDADLRSQVEDLVKSVVPEEIDNIDEMILQFSGREEELIDTLKTMQERSIEIKQQELNKESAASEPKEDILNDVPSS